MSKNVMVKNPLDWIGGTESEKKTVTKSARLNTPKDWVRATFQVNEDTLEAIKDLAYTDRKKIKTVINDALLKHLEGRKLMKRPKGADND